MSDDFPSDSSSKQACRELARRLATAEGARAARDRQREGTWRLPTPAFSPWSPPPVAPVPATSLAGLVPDAFAVPPRWPRAISIWEPRGTGAELVFVRPEPLPLGDHFAARAQLRPKRAPLPLRVCLFGESAAAGYLYAPHVTPAGVLEAQLRAVAGDGAVEVIDLARTNETLPSLLATVESAVQIQPDVLVIFAGNNWNLLETPEVSPYAPSVAARQDYAAAWRAAGGPAGPRALAVARLRALVDNAAERLALLAGAMRIPVILVVPEVSLTGWESRQPLAWQPGTDARTISRWYRLLAASLRHLQRGAWKPAERAARAMLALDGGTGVPTENGAVDGAGGVGGGNPTSWRLLALAKLGACEAADEVASAARAEITAAAYPTLAFLAAPQATPLAQELLRQAARRHGFACVDLPAVFREHTGSPLPGRQLFLDYCHLTAEGIEVSMAAVAAEVLRLSGIADGVAEDAHGGAAIGEIGEISGRELLRRLPPLRVPAEVEAVARLGAAIHGAHRLLAVGAKAPFLAAWCDAALEASPAVESAMLDLVAARVSPLPALLTPAQGRNLASPYRLGLPHGWRWEHLDAEVLLAIAASLDRRAGAPSRARYQRRLTDLLIAHRALPPQGIDLLAASGALWEPLERFYPDVMSFDDLPRPATLRAPWPETSFCLVCSGHLDAGPASEAGHDVELEITARLPMPPTADPGEPAAAGRRRGRVRILVDGRPAATVRLGESWSRGTVRLPRRLLRAGLNRLTLGWPMPTCSADVALAAALDRLDQGIAADLHPVFGEIYSLVARPIAAVAPTAPANRTPSRVGGH